MRINAAEHYATSSSLQRFARFLVAENQGGHMCQEASVSTLALEHLL